MRLVDVHARILAMKQPVFQTADAAALLQIERAHASKLLARLAQAGHLMRLRRGVWCIPNSLDPLAVPPHITAPFPSYVSLQSALYHHGMIDQIPAVIYAVSLARTRIFRTPLGTVSIHHMAPAFFLGFTRTEGGVQMATPEKALLDILYLSPAKTRLFAALPELELPRTFSIRRAREMIDRVGSTRRKTLVNRRFEALLDKK